jgi:hypothetical protein
VRRNVQPAYWDLAIFKRTNNDCAVAAKEKALASCQGQQQSWEAEVCRSDKIRGRQTMRKLLVILAAACTFTATSAATVTAQVTGIRHSDGSWTFVDAKGRDIHGDYYAGRVAPQKRRNRHDTSRHDREALVRSLTQGSNAGGEGAFLRSANA